jgi:tetratricopeptide (TPR) repeat protein
MKHTPHPASRRQSRTLRQAPTPADLALRKALEFHQRGQLAEAEPIYRQILATDPLHADSLHLLGLLAHQVGRNDIAVELIGKAIAVDKRQSAFHSNLGTALQALGRLEEAAASYQQALALNPALAEAYLNLGVVLQAQGKLSEAEVRLRQALALKPHLAEVHVNLGNILQAQGKLEESTASIERALALNPQFFEAHYNLGNTLLAQGKLDEAAASYRRATEIKPELAEVHGNLGNVLLAQQKPDDAVASYERALELKPDYAEACYNLGNARQAQDKLDEAVACYERAIVLKPHLPEAHYNLGNTFHTQDKLNEAAGSFERALALRPDYAEAHYNLGCVFREQGRVEEATAGMARALAINPEYPQARFGHALAQLLAGNFDSGWRNYESRWQSSDHDTPWRAYPQPLWAGEKLEHGRLLLWGEQGIGDEVQFAGLIPEAIRTDNRIVLDCDPRLQPLFARSFPGIEVVSKLNVDRGSSKDLEPEDQEIVGAPSLARSCFCAKGGIPQISTDPALNATREFAAHLPTGSLPGLFRTTEAAFAATVSPYLKADPAGRECFRSRYDDGRRLIGLAWRTNNSKTGRKRSIDLPLLGSLFAQPGQRWISLQYGNFESLEEQVKLADAPVVIDREVDQFANIDLFASQVAAMDLVITIDNSTAHLAGALGVPVWLLLPFAADWRWLQQRQDSPWYPSMRLFRQPAPGDWVPVIRCVMNALRA